MRRNLNGEFQTGTELTGYAIGAGIGAYVLLRFTDEYPLTVLADFALLFALITLRILVRGLKVSRKPSRFDHLFLAAVTGYAIPPAVAVAVVLVRAIIALLSLL